MAIGRAVLPTLSTTYAEAEPSGTGRRTTAARRAPAQRDHARISRISTSVTSDQRPERAKTSDPLLTTIGQWLPEQPYASSALVSTPTRPTN
jgi:hypothetical protein